MYINMCARACMRVCVCVSDYATSRCIIRCSDTVIEKVSATIELILTGSKTKLVI